MSKRNVAGLGLVVGLLVTSLWSQEAVEPTPEQLAQFVQIKHIAVKGTRLPALSVVRIIGIQSGDQVNDASVKKACYRLQSTGLIKSVAYEYLLYPDKTEADLTLTIVDEPALVPLIIEPKRDSELLSKALTALDPLFTTTLPLNEKAIGFYARNLTACLRRMGRDDEYAAPKLQGNPGETPTGVIFEIKKRKTPPAGKHGS